ncbi:ATP-binding protein [Microbulbifer bruguierae]|uniref:histidine kinase n=1 Tax=Microbulbifer bruguierae TaxID=3029061 RepID=A0ABY8N9I1_9GAMM|nr:ATP-binding protein [Microbulbifer bruguierae]WGL15554.1 ATP-binding protein [Microbulbifer bruguierae]
MRKQMLRLVGVLTLALVVVYSAVATLYNLYSAAPHEYTISAAQLAEALERGEAPIAQRYSADAIHFAKPLRKRLDAGEVVGLDTGENQILFYHLNGNTILEVGPFPHQPAESVTQWRLLFIGVMLVMLALLTWPLFRDLNQLQNQAIRFSQKPFNMPEAVSRRSTIYPLAETFRRMANIVTGYFEMNQDLARTIAHEIRTPLARIKFQQALVDSDSESAQVISRATRDIEQLVEKYLNFARIEINEQLIARKPVALESFFDELGSTLEVQCPELEIAYYFPDGEGWLEPDSLTIAIQNLVVNAGKYARDRVNLHFDFDGEFCVLRIEDNGPGLGGDALELTDAFTRSATDDQGYGLGLYIVKKVMMWHEGELSLDRSPTLGGTRATLRWPNKR